MKTEKMNRIWLQALLVFAAMCSGLMSELIWAQTLAEKEKQWQSCEAAHYTGPREGRRNYTLDNYLWVVTPEFAKRYCMPERMVSTELKGAEAIAFRMVDGADMDRCGVDDQGQHHCTRQSMGRFEIYVPQSLKLPASNPDVRFYDSRRNTSEWLIEDHTPIQKDKSYLYGKGQYTPPAGTVPRFANIFWHPDPGYTFGLMFMVKGALPWTTSALYEVGFKKTVVPGMDLLILEDTLNFGFVRELNFFKITKSDPKDASSRYLIVMHKRDTDSRNKKDKRVPEDFEHVIYLPHAFAMQVRETATKNGASNFADFINTFQQR